MKALTPNRNALSLGFCLILLFQLNTASAQYTDNTKSRHQTQLQRLATFGWNKESNRTICKALRGWHRFRKTINSDLYIGAAFSANKRYANTAALNNLENQLKATLGNAITIKHREARIATLKVSLKTHSTQNCSVKLKKIRKLSNVAFITPENNPYQSAVKRLYNTGFASKRRYSNTCNPEDRKNPADYLADPEVSNPDSATYKPYKHWIDGDCKYRDMKTPNIMTHHNLTTIYEGHQYYGDPEFGVAVLDNGIIEADQDYLEEGGNMEAKGFYNPILGGWGPNDGTAPRLNNYPSFLPSLSKMLYEHGSKQATNIYKVAPSITIHTARTSPYVVWFRNTHLSAVTQAILHYADDDNIKIISNSMATPFYSFRVARAIRYFNSKGKIFVTAAGTSPMPDQLIKLFGAPFPARMESTITATGTRWVNGEEQLQATSWGGNWVDFTVRDAISSSPATSHTAAIIALVWSANPDLSREDIIDILIDSSHYEEKHPLFGWGNINAGDAYETVISN